MYDDSSISDGPIEISTGTKIHSKGLYDTLIKHSNNGGECLKRFVEGVGGSRLKFEYTDKYLTSQLGMIITGQFIERMLSEASCTDYSIEMTILTDRKKDGDTYPADHRYRELWSHIVSRDRKDFLRAILYQRFDDSRYKVTNVNEHEKMPHYRRLKMKRNTLRARMNRRKWQTFCWSMA